MSKFNNDKVMPRYMAVAVVLTLISISVIGKSLYTMTVRKQYWTEVADRQKRDSVPVAPNRGNLFSADGQLIATSIPEYELFIDFQPGKTKTTPMDPVKAHELDSLWAVKMDSICNGLDRILPGKSPAEFRKRIEEGRHRVLADGSVGARHWKIWPRRVDYNTYHEVQQLPIFNLPQNKGGFGGDEFVSRRHPFGSLAWRTIGDIGSEKKRAANGRIYTMDSARFGLELACDTLLRGTHGLVHRQKVLNKYMNISEVMPEHGCDVVTTLDVNMQDIAERALVDELKEINGEMGVVILMEVATGDVKAIVNMTRCEDGKYRELYNNAISYGCEPGSVFKTASFLVALDDGVVDTSYVIHTGCGVMPMYGREMKDHNWRRGGYGDINVARALEVSSNIGVSHVIDKHYHDQAERYVEGLYRVGIGEDLKLPIKGYLPPKIRMPKRKKNGRYDDNWYATTLPWMSIGYETQITPINTATFYNAIANDGKMMRPRFVKEVVKNGETIAEYPPEVIKEQIAKPKAIKTMQTILEHVVSQGLGRRAGNKLFKVAGKTGTAQVSQGKAGYKSGVVQYWLSFAGYFPANNPRYTCLVCIKKAGLPASGGSMSGAVFHDIALGVMARNLKMSVGNLQHETSMVIPDAKSGDIPATNYVLQEVGIKKHIDQPDVKYGQHITPDVKGMGAKDAVYCLESRGLKVRLQGRGKVVSQSYPAGKEIVKGSECTLVLE